MKYIISFHCIDSGVYEEYTYSYLPAVPRFGEYVYIATGRHVCGVNYKYSENVNEIEITLKYERTKWID